MQLPLKASDGVSSNTYSQDRNLLGRSELAYTPNSGYSDPRLSFPTSNPLNKRRRVVGDASHHFRYFLPPGPVPHPPSEVGLRYGGQLDPSPISRSVLGHGRSRTIGELPPKAQMITPPLHTGQLQFLPLYSDKLLTSKSSISNSDA